MRRCVPHPQMHAQKVLRQQLQHRVHFSLNLKMGPQIPEDAEVVPMLWVEDEELVVLVEQIPRVKAQDGEVGVRGHGPGDIPATSLPGPGSERTTVLFNRNIQFLVLRQADDANGTLAQLLLVPVLEQLVPDYESPVQQPCVRVGLSQQRKLVGEETVAATNSEIAPLGLQPQGRRLGELEALSPSPSTAAIGAVLLQWFPFILLIGLQDITMICTLLPLHQLDQQPSWHATPWPLGDVRGVQPL
mmetsp:Transcript_62446/g.103721  ORF Transcript_62446/g.103721 Transcript_62446/m.103721 type:complete len:245 (+) Transcript_62446:835-1569(+)